MPRLPSPDTRPLLLYDGLCPLCNWVVRYVLRVDRKGVILLAALQSETASTLMKRYPSIARLDTVILIEGEKMSLRSLAIQRIIAITGGWRRLLLPLFLLPRPLLDGIYNWIARNRYRWFGKYDSCPMIPPPYRDRFLP